MKEAKTKLVPPQVQLAPPQVVVRVMKDGREVINLLKKAGRDLYEQRKRAMWERQGRRCCLESRVKGCPGKLAWADCVFEHQDGRGMEAGHRDDRIERPDPKTGKMEPYNGAAHARCNALKMSIRVNYHDAP